MGERLVPLDIEIQEDSLSTKYQRLRDFLLGPPGFYKTST